MIVNIRVEVTDEQRNVFSRKLHPKAEKRLASRAEFNEAVLAHVAELVASAPVNADLARARVGLEEKRAPAATQDATACSDTEHGRSDVEVNPLDLADGPSPIGRTLRSLNNAMFSLERATRHANAAGFSDDIHRLLEDVCNFRVELVQAFDREAGA